MLTLSDIEHILTFYAIGTLYGVTHASRGFVNETAFIQTSSGRYVVRRNHRRLGEASQHYRHRLISHLVDCDFPTPPLIATRSGDTLLKLDNRFYEILSYVEGKDYDPQQPYQLASVGTTLAQYHRLISDVPPPLDTTPPRYLPMNTMAQVENLLIRDVMGELYEPLAWYADRAARLRVVLSETAYQRLPHCVIHGDIHRDNLLFAGNEVVALIDYDQVAWDARLVDLADALVGFASTKAATGQLNWGVFSGPLNEEKSVNLMAAYTEVFPLTHAEIMLLPSFIEVLWLQAELGRVISTPEGAPDYHISVLEQGRELSKWIGAHSEQLTTLWSRNNPVTDPGSTAVGKSQPESAMAA